MKIVSIQVGRIRTVPFKGKDVTTGIFKLPVKGPVRVETLRLEGDEQADLKVHGGADKAVYAYSLDTLPWWRQKRPNDVFDYGSFGENLSIDQINEDQVFIGDVFEVGTALLQVSEPRFPCFKLGIKFNDQEILKQFMELGRSGVYFRVLREGEIDVGQNLKLISQEKVLAPISEFFEFTQKKPTKKRVEELLQVQGLTVKWRAKLEALLP